MATRAAQPVPTTALDATYHPATAGPGNDKVPPDTILHVKNGSGGSVTLTVATPRVVDGDLAVADRTVAIPAGEERFERVTQEYRGSDGLVTLTWSAVTTVEFAVIR